MAKKKIIQESEIMENSTAKTEDTSVTIAQEPESVGGSISAPNGGEEKYGIVICKTKRYLSWVDDKWYETSSAMSQTYTMVQVDEAFEKLKNHCYITSIDVVDLNGNVIEHKGTSNAFGKRPTCVESDDEEVTNKPKVFFPTCGLGSGKKRFVLHKPKRKI